jgi:tetratricopeptide (TPR) repeat protein
MENTRLVDISARTAYFRRGVVANVRYWQGWLKDNPSNVIATDQERDSILKAIDFGLNLENAWVSVRDLILAFTPYMEQRGYWGIWSETLHRAIHIAQKIDDKANEVSLSLLLARVSFQQSDFKESVYYYRRTIGLARQLKDENIEARACSNLGFYYVEQGQWLRAEILCCHALKIFEAINSNHGRAHTENHLAILRIWQEQWKEAERHLQRACQLWRDMGDKSNLTRGINNLGLLYNSMDQPEKSLHYLQEAVRRSKEAKDENLTALAYMNTGIAYRQKRDYISAAKYLWEARAIFKRLSNLFGYTLVLDNLGLLYLNQQQWLEAEKYLTEALAAWRTLDNWYHETQVLIYLTDYEQARGEQRQAKVWLDEAEGLLAQHDSSRKYRPLWARISNRSRDLLG